MGPVGLGHDQHATGVAIQPMDDPGPRRAAGSAELVEMKLQGRGERASPMPFGRVDDHPRRLVDRRQRGVFVENVERNVFRLRAVARRRFKRDQSHTLSKPQSLRRLPLFAIDLDAQLADGPTNSARLCIGNAWTRKTSSRPPTNSSPTTSSIGASPGVSGTLRTMSR